MVVVGNSGLRHLRDKVEKFLNYPAEEVRSHARWALNRLNLGEERESRRADS